MQNVFLEKSSAIFIHSHAVLDLPGDVGEWYLNTYEWFTKHWTLVKHEALSNKYRFIPKIAH